MYPTLTTARRGIDSPMDSDEFVRTLFHREARFHAVFETIDDAIVLIDEWGVIVEANPATARLFGYATDELVGRDIGMLMPEPHRSRHGDYLRRYRDTGIRRILGSGSEMVACRKDGRLIPIRLSIGELTLDDRRYFTGIVHDLSERVRADRERRELAEIVQKSGDCIAVLGLDGSVQYLNPLGLQLFGEASLERVRHRPFGEFLSDEDRNRFQDQILPEVLTKGKFTGELQLNPDGRKLPETIAGLLFLLNDEATGQPRAIAAVNRVVSEQKRLEQQFRQAQKMEAVGRLAGGVAHDFNNLLTVINGYCELLCGDPMLPSGHRDLINEVHQAGLRASNLTRQLLAFSHNSLVHATEVHLGRTVAAMEKMLARLIGEDICFQIRTDPSLDFVVADVGQIEQVILNLIVNSRDAIPTRGAIAVETANTTIGDEEARLVGDCRPGDYVRLSVIDNGCGISPESMRHLFEPFYTTKGQGRGTGLGLATVFGIVQRFGGFIRVESELEKGSQFHLFFPRAVPETEPIVPETAKVATAPRGRETVLLVEDDVGVRRLTRLLLQQLGYQVLEAENGEQALQRVQAKQGRIDLVITDVVMPELSGRELIDLLRPRYPNIKILCISGYTNDEILRNGISTDSVAFLQKPFTSEGLAKKVREVINGE